MKYASQIKLYFEKHKGRILIGLMFYGCMLLLLRRNFVFLILMKIEAISLSDIIVTVFLKMRQFSQEDSMFLIYKPIVLNSIKVCSKFNQHKYDAMSLQQVSPS